MIPLALTISGVKFDKVAGFDSQTTTMDFNNKAKASALNTGDVTVWPIRLFGDSPESFTAVCGNEYEEHDVWRVEKNKARLVGTLTEQWYKKIRRTRQLQLPVAAEFFQWLNPDFSSAKTLTGHVDDAPSREQLMLGNYQFAG